MVSPETKNSSIRMYHGPIDSRPAPPGPGSGPRSRAGPPGSRRPPPSARRAGSGVGGVGLHQVEQAVEQLDQLQPEGLERLVPLAVPVGVGDDGDTAGAHGPPGYDGRSDAASLPCAGGRALEPAPTPPGATGPSRSGRRRPARRQTTRCPRRSPRPWAALWAADPGAPDRRGAARRAGWWRAGELDERTREAAARPAAPPGCRRRRPGAVVDADLARCRRWPASAPCGWGRWWCRSTPPTPSASWPTSSGDVRPALAVVDRPEQADRVRRASGGLTGSLRSIPPSSSGPACARRAGRASAGRPRALDAAAGRATRP